jgi:hypothetical protein
MANLKRILIHLDLPSEGYRRLSQLQPSMRLQLGRRMERYFTQSPETVGLTPLPDTRQAHFPRLNLNAKRFEAVVWGPIEIVISELDDEKHITIRVTNTFQFNDYSGDDGPPRGGSGSRAVKVPVSTADVIFVAVAIAIRRSIKEMGHGIMSRIILSRTFDLIPANLDLLFAPVELRFIAAAVGSYVLSIISSASNAGIDANIGTYRPPIADGIDTAIAGMLGLDLQAPEPSCATGANQADRWSIAGHGRHDMEPAAGVSAASVGWWRIPDVCHDGFDTGNVGTITNGDNGSPHGLISLDWLKGLQSRNEDCLI